MISKRWATLAVLSLIAPTLLSAQAFATRDADRWEAWPRCGHGSPCDSTTGVSRPALRIAAKMVAAGPTLSARWPSLWPVGQPFVIEMPYRSQVLVVARTRPGPGFWGAKDEKGRPQLRGWGWVTETSRYYARDPLGSYLRGLPRTSDIRIGDDWGMDRPVSDVAMVDALLRSAHRLRAGSDTLFEARHHPAGRYGFRGCPFPSDSSCAAVLALEWRLLHEAVARPGAGAPEAVRDFLAIRGLRLANADSPDAEPFFATFGGREGWAVAMGAAIVFRRDTSGYERSLLRDTTTYRPAWVDHWPPREASAGEALAGELMLLLLRRSGRPADAGIPPGTTLEALLGRTVGFDSLSATERGARLLDGIGLGPRSPLPPPPPGPFATWGARGTEEVRASYFAAGLQRMARDTFPLVLDLEVGVWHSIAGTPWLEPGDDGHFVVGDSVAEIHPSPRQVTLHLNGVTVEGRGIPTAIFHAPNGLEGGARLVFYLPDSLLAPLVRSLSYRDDDPLRYGGMQTRSREVVVAVDSGVTRYFTCCGVALMPSTGDPADLPQWVGTRYVGPPRPDTPPAIVFRLPGPPPDTQLARGRFPLGGRAVPGSPNGTIVIRFAAEATVTQRHEAVDLVRARVGGGLVVTAERTALIPLREGVGSEARAAVVRSVEGMPGVQQAQILPPD